VVPDPEVPGGERIKVLDFGLAKLLIGRGSLATHTGSIFGTPAYMAPEQCMDAGAVDHRADLYAIGCMFYACVCGRPPFASNNPMQVMLAHMNEAVPPPRSLQPALPPYHEGLILNLLQKRPEDRLPSCTALIEALDHGAVLFGSSMHSTPASTGLAMAGTQLATGSQAPAGSSPGARPGPASPSGLGHAPTAAPSALHGLGHAPTAAPSASHALGHAPTAAPSASHALGHAPTAAPSPSHALGHAPTAAPSASHGLGHAPTAAPSPSHGLGHAPTAAPSPSHGLGHAPTAAPTAAPSAAHALGHAPTALPHAPHAPAHPNPQAPPYAPHGPGHAPTALPHAPHAPAHPNPQAPPYAPYAPAPPISVAPPASYAPAHPNPHAPPVMSPAVAQSSMSAGAGHVQAVETPRRSRWPLIAGAAAVLTIVGLAAALLYVMNRAPDTQVVARNDESPPAEARVDETNAAGATAEAPAQVAASAAAGAPSGAAARTRPALAALPGNAQAVARIDVPRVIASPLYAKLLPMLGAQADEAFEALHACGQDRIDALKTITLTSVGKNAKIAVVIEGLGREALAACLRGMAAAAGEAEDWEVRQDGKFTVARGDGETVWFGWLGDTAFVTGADAKNKARIADMLDGKGGVAENPRAMALIGSVDPNAAIWLVVPKVDPAETGMAHESLYMSIDLASGLAMTIGLRHASHAAAVAAAAKLQQERAKLQGTPFGAISIETRQNDVLIRLRLSMDALEQLMQGNGMDAALLQELMPAL
jgi:hypothetical protein